MATSQKKYDLPRAKNRCNNRVKGTRVDPTSHNVVVIATNLKIHHQANVVIDPITGASLEYRHLIKGPTKAIWENLFANEIGQLAQGVGTRIP